MAGLATLNRMDRLTLRRAGSNLPWQPGKRQLFILPTRAGAIIGLAQLVMLLGSLNYNNNLGIAFSFIFLASTLVSAVLTNRNLQAVRLLEAEALPVHAGQTLVVHIFWQHPQPGFPLHVQAVHGETAIANNRVLLNIPAQRRGWLELPALRLSNPYPLGLFRAWTWWKYPRRILIWPCVESQPPPIPVEASRQTRTGQSLQQGDLTELKSYEPGEPLSRVAWKILARHGQWLSRQPEPAGSHQGPIVLKPALTGLSDREAAISRLAAWVQEAERQALPYGLDLGDGHPLPAALGEQHLMQCMERLALA